MQSLQLICSLTPSSTEPSTWLVIIWLKRWLARPLIELPLDPPSVGVGVGVGVGEAEGEGVGDGEVDGLGDGDGQGPSQSPSTKVIVPLDCATAEVVCRVTVTSEIAAVSANATIRLLAVLIMVS